MQTKKRVITVGPMPPEKCAYALARYSRSPDSIRESVDWVRAHDSQKFLEHFYFQYGHASIADLGHTVICFEGLSELAATEIEEEPLWDGQAKSSRYQDFSRGGFIRPAELEGEAAERYARAGEALLEAYATVNALAFECLAARLPCPAEMDREAYRRNITARAFDVARYLLFWGVPTNVGQVASIRTLEKQVRRLAASPYAELRDLGAEIAAACAAKPDCIWDEQAGCEALAPTLARHAEPDEHVRRAHAHLARWAEANLPKPVGLPVERVDLVRPENVAADVAATLLYPVTDRPFRELYELACGWSAAVRKEVIDTALGSRTRRDELLAGFRSAPYAFDLAIDVGAYRDLHRHRRCHKYRQGYSGNLGFETPALIGECGAAEIYSTAMRAALDAMHALPEPGAHYLLPFGARSRFLFKMDFAEAEYMVKLRSGVKGHFSYRQVAWDMKCRMEEVEPELGRVMEATPPWVEDPLKR